MLVKGVVCCLCLHFTGTETGLLRAVRLLEPGLESASSGSKVGVPSTLSLGGETEEMQAEELFEPGSGALVSIRLSQCFQNVVPLSMKHYF